MSGKHRRRHDPRERLAAESKRSAEYEGALAAKEALEAYRGAIKPNGGIAYILLGRAWLDLERAINASLKEAGAKFVIAVDEDFEMRRRAWRPDAPRLASLGVPKVRPGPRDARGVVAAGRRATARLPYHRRGFASCDGENQESMAQHVESLATTAGAPRLVFIVPHLDSLKNRIERALATDVRPAGSRVRNADPQAPPIALGPPWLRATPRRGPLMRGSRVG